MYPNAIVLGTITAQLSLLSGSETKWALADWHFMLNRGKTL